MVNLAEDDGYEDSGYQGWGEETEAEEMASPEEGRIDYKGEQ